MQANRWKSVTGTNYSKLTVFMLHFAFSTKYNLLPYSFGSTPFRVNMFVVYLEKKIYSALSLLSSRETFLKIVVQVDIHMLCCSCVWFTMGTQKFLWLIVCFWNAFIFVTQIKQNQNYIWQETCQCIQTVLLNHQRKLLRTVLADDFDCKIAIFWTTVFL